MCGIAGFYRNQRGGAFDCQAVVSKMSECMVQRGPDANGIWTSKDITLSHRRLSILDLDSRSNQPMLSSCGRYTIVFNGEIYNYQDLKRDLEKDGVVFKTLSDTEVLLALFIAKKEKMLMSLRGMFAFAIWDDDLGELFLARDPYGIKPLYYASTQSGFLFASQVKALLSSGLVSKKKELAGIAGFYLWGSVPEPWTIYNGVYAVPAGHWMKIKHGAITEMVCWHDITEHWQSHPEKISNYELQEKIYQALKDSIQSHIVADVPISIFLSGGIDSGILAGLITEFKVPVEGITVGFEEFVGSEKDETVFAEAIASHYAIPHHIKWVTRKEFEDDIPFILKAMDQPSIDGVNTWFASKAAAERGFKLSLSGIGGDELFCGYSSFQRISNLLIWGTIASKIIQKRQKIINLFTWFAKQRSQPKIAGIPRYIGSLEGMYFLERSLFLSSELPNLMGLEEAKEGLERLGGEPPGMKKIKSRDDISTIAALESRHYLRNQLLKDTDWASMSHSLELRTPLVDIVLLNKLGPFVSSFKNGTGKKMLSNSAINPLPDSIRNKPKSGFDAPMHKWLLNSNHSSLKSKINSPKLSRSPWARQWARFVIEEF